MKYESPASYGSLVMTKVKVFKSRSSTKFVLIGPIEEKKNQDGRPGL